ncbi:MAG: cytochrome-c oxidase, cbb3-type subunit III [Acidibrevibacterium sp.]|jgi:cytochrome c oxidase cbb3-type subunit 3|uniref:cytochrome-c oxidase, cbb3-type subunit III n=1 Tax=Acidibrevibacterium fodinaquatile TaxID=1969806 RepID=UPI0023A86085|nr:cytochrome-c oxidase, cbb3-type subunit III [Acidibrevibacterium fodinaquatile]MCA7120706.1 cytochrome-c oxidase, cbb3-type subunit III [Acidibrevibacterium fodinaquatile]
MPTKIEKDVISGRDTTGHEWDGIRELNTPLPKWWVYVYLATIVWALGMFVLYPAIPLGTRATTGLLGFSSRAQAMAGFQEMNALHATQMQEIGRMSFADIEKNHDLMEVALTAGRITFANNCQPCHGPNGEGRIGYPALDTDVWRWGGSLDAIQQTITHGIRSADPDARNSQMPNFGGDKLLTPAQIEDVADYVMTLYGKAKPGVDTSAGEKLFGDNCAPCHGAKAEGNRDVGAPPLASRVHLYGDSRAAVVAQITHPRMGVMPNWNHRLSPATIKAVALYVHSLGGGE